jgi:hypothetical protein
MVKEFNNNLTENWVGYRLNRQAISPIFPKCHFPALFQKFLSSQKFWIAVNFCEEKFLPRGKMPLRLAAMLDTLVENMKRMMLGPPNSIRDRNYQREMNIRVHTANDMLDLIAEAEGLEYDPILDYILIES